MSAPDTIESTAIVVAADQRPVVPLHYYDAPVALQSQLMQSIADEARRVIDDRKWFVSIQGKKHIEVEGWQFIAGLLRCCAKVTSTAKLDDDVEGYEAHAVVVRADTGIEVSAADGMCARDEKRWKSAERYAIRSMAQTRACSRAIQHAFRFIAELAGYSGTPAEEVPEGGFDPPTQRNVAPPVRTPRPARATPPPPRGAPPERAGPRYNPDTLKRRIFALCGELKMNDGDRHLLCRNMYHRDSLNDLTVEQLVDFGKYLSALAEQNKERPADPFDDAPDYPNPDHDVRGEEYPV